MGLLGFVPQPNRASQDLKIRNYELRQLCEQCDILPDEDQKALIVMMDSLVKKSDVTKVISKAASVRSSNM